MKALFLGAFVATAVATLLAAPAQADAADYLGPLRAHYNNFLTDQQLLDEGSRVCAAAGRGMHSADAVEMVRDDLSLSVTDAMEIESAAILDLC